MSLREFLDEMGGADKPPKYSELLQVSGLTSEEALEFKAAWPSVPDARKREALTRLIELCEGNMELDFNAAFKVCLDDADDVVREKAAQGLWDCDDRTVIRPLIRLLKDDPSPKVRAAVGISLGKFATMAQNGKLLSRDAHGIRDALMAVIGRHDEEVEVIRRAIEAVASFDVPEVDEIIRGAYHSGDPKLMQSSLYAMAQSSNSQWLPSVIEEMDHEHAPVRYEATQACGLLGDESADADGFEFWEDGVIEEMAFGAATIASEILDDPEPWDSVIVPVGNGSLIKGIGQVFKARSPHTRVVGVVPSGAPSMADAILGRPWDEAAAINTHADGLAVRVPIRGIVEELKELIDDTWLVEESRLLPAVKSLIELEQVMVEPSAAITLAGLAEQREVVGRREATIPTGAHLRSTLIPDIMRGDGLT